MEPRDWWFNRENQLSIWSSIQSIPGIGLEGGKIYIFFKCQRCFKLGHSDVSYRW